MPTAGRSEWFPPLSAVSWWDAFRLLFCRTGTGCGWLFLLEPRAFDVKPFKVKQIHVERFKHPKGVTGGYANWSCPFHKLWKRSSRWGCPTGASAKESTSKLWKYLSHTIRRTVGRTCEQMVYVRVPQVDGSHRERHCSRQACL